MGHSASGSDVRVGKRAVLLQAMGRCAEVRSRQGAWWTNLSMNAATKSTEGARRTRIRMAMIDKSEEVGRSIMSRRTRKSQQSEPTSCCPCGCYFRFSVSFNGHGGLGYSALDSSTSASTSRPAWLSAV